MYDKIYDFCKVRNAGSIYRNGLDYSPRVKFLLDLTTELGLNPEVHEFKVGESTLGFNIVLRGESTRMVTAHHDIVNPDIDNANDNSASVINAIATKLLKPGVTVVLLDGEEVGGLGAHYLSEGIHNGEFGEVEWILNLELTGRGGSTFFIGDYPGKLRDHIRRIFDCPIVSTPFNDSVIFREHGIDSVVINPLPILNEGTSPVMWGDSYLDYDMLFNCHTRKDTLDTISTEDMQKFVEGVIIPIIS
ncbi:Peptidase M28 [uncultured Caudovirales phage]|uniref:Peptidase M28 n=1 Tax=uncultured Caudovirales phage TaxID=2100421 RepID=A0A6J5Q747_9CAUD|nr:Peptidase M28 [uncultured Caudovirales phage]